MQRITFADRELWYVDVAAEAAEHPLTVLFVHGYPLDHAMWMYQFDGDLAAQAGRPVRILAPDLRGLGRSPTSGDKVTMQDFADDLAGFLDALGVTEPVVYCGLSMGGYIAFQFWRKYAARLRGLVLCDTRAAADTAEAAAGRLAMAEQVLREGPAPLVDTMMPKLFAPRTQREGPEIVEKIRNVEMTTDPCAIAAAARGMAERPDMTSSLPEIQCPTLVIVGSDDMLTPPADMRRMADQIPKARLVEIANAGHLSPIENPAEFNAALAGFLADL